MKYSGRFVCRFLVGLMTLSALVACGDNDSNHTQEESNPNNAPSLTVPADQIITEGTELTFNVTGTDPDAGDMLTFQMSGAPDGAVLESTNGAFVWTPSFDQTGLHRLGFTVTDGEDTDTAMVEVTVLIDPARGATPIAGGTLNPLTIPKYVTPLVIPPVMENTGTADDYSVAVRQFEQQILPGGIWNTINGRNDQFPATTVWGYGPESNPAPDSTAIGGGPGIAPAANSQFNYPAYTVETKADMPVRVRWTNDLVDANGNYLPHLFPVDQNLHWANPMMECREGSPRTDCVGDSNQPYSGPVPMVPHVHGAHVAGHSDGYPEAWWLPAANDLPPGIATAGTLFDDATGVNPGTLGYADYLYRNDQPATTLWYHDHSLGMTRLNVYAGPAGFWLVRGDYDGETQVVPDAIDDQGTLTINDGVLPGPAPIAGDSVLELNVPGDPVRSGIREIPIVIQGRSFNQDGSLFYPEQRAFFEGLDPSELIIDFAGDPENPTDIAPIWNPEAFFNVTVVNGVSWPELEVAQATYRFRLLNGANSRFLNLAAFKVDPLTGEIMPDKELPFYQIGTEQGALPQVIKISTGFATNYPGDGTVPANTPANDPGQAVLMGPAERADMLVDFSGTYVDGSLIANGDVIRVVNTAGDEPFGGIDPLAVADFATTGQVMQFQVDGNLTGLSPTDPTGATPATTPADIVLNPEPLVTDAVATTRQVSLNEEHSLDVCVRTDNIDGVITQIDPAALVLDPTLPAEEAFEAACEDAGGEPFAPKAALLGTVDLDGVAPLGIGLLWTDTSGVSQPANVTMADGSVLQINVTENPIAGDTEMWEIYNFTEDAHPIHLHLVRFEVVERRLIGSPPGSADSVLSASQQPWEVGYKDTVIAYPGEITVVKAKFDLPGLYVWHCHILEHEDNEMMRPYVVSPAF